MDKLQAFLEKYIGPLATKLNASKTVQAMTAGMMGVMSISLGMAVLSILLYLPIPAWQEFLTNTGMLAVGMQALAVTSNMLAPYALISVARAYADIHKINVINVVVMSLATFFILMPLIEEVGEYTTTYTLAMTYLGANGLFTGMLLGLFIPAVYRRLIDKVGIKLPDSVPTMVTDSLKPTFVAMIVFTSAFLVKWVFTLTAFGDFFTFFNSIISAPVMSLGASPLALIVVFGFSSLLWFFGIHPAAIINVYAPALATAMGTNAMEFLAGTPSSELSYLAFHAVYPTLTIGGSGCMIGLALSLLFAKSERYRAFRNIAFVPAMFNISEPIMFGLPVVLNPLFFIPLVLAVPVVGGVSLLLANLGLANGFIPVISVPWIMPAPIQGFLQGGFGYMIIMLVAVALSFILYFPFFKVADNQALAEEKSAAEGAHAEVSE